jgi:hypothetical protein
MDETTTVTIDGELLEAVKQVAVLALGLANFDNNLASILCQGAQQIIEQTA